MIAPTPVRSESRICFGLEWYATEEEAETASAIARERDERYNGGYSHGMLCGRDASFDSAGLFAVTRG